MELKLASQPFGYQKISKKRNQLFLDGEESIDYIATGVRYAEQ